MNPFAATAVGCTSSVNAKVELGDNQGGASRSTASSAVAPEVPPAKETMPPAPASPDGEMRFLLSADAPATSVVGRDVTVAFAIVGTPTSALVDIFVPETYQSAIQVMRERCNGCGACVGICPPQVIHIEVV